MFFSGLEGHWNSSCRVLSVPFVCQLRASLDTRPPAVRYCLYFLSDNFRPRGTLRLQLSSIICSFDLSLAGLEGRWGPSCRVLSVLSVYQVRASKDTGAQAFGYCLFFLSVNCRPRGTLGLKLSGIVCHFCLSISGLEGHWGSSCRALYVLSVCQFRASRDTGLQLSGTVCSFCLSIGASIDTGARAVRYCLSQSVNCVPRGTLELLKRLQGP